MWAWGCYGRTLAPRQHRRSPAPALGRRHHRVRPRRSPSCGAPSACPSPSLVAGPIIATFLYGMVRFQQRLFAFRRSRTRAPACASPSSARAPTAPPRCARCSSPPSSAWCRWSRSTTTPGCGTARSTACRVTGSVDDLPRDRRRPRRAPDPAGHALRTAAGWCSTSPTPPRRPTSRCGSCGSPPRGCTACPACAR